MAKTWAPVPALVSASFTNTTSQAIPDDPNPGISSTVTATGMDDISIEHIEVAVNITHTFRGDLEIVLTSPSTLERLLELRDPPPRAMRRALEKTRLVAIGAVTAEAIEQAGLPVAATAADPTDEGITSCILSLF